MWPLAGSWPIWLAVEETDFDFYSTSAQVIPLIFVALAFEFRGKGGQFLPPDLLPGDPGRLSEAEADAAVGDPKGRAILFWAAVYTFLMTLVLVAGEVVALQVIAYDDPWKGSRPIVGTALTVGALGIIVPIAIQQYNTVTRVRRRQAQDEGRSTKAPDEPAVANVPRTAFRLVTGLAGAIAAGVAVVAMLMDRFS